MSMKLFIFIWHFQIRFFINLHFDVHPSFFLSPHQNMSADNLPNRTPSPSQSNDDSTTASDTSNHGPLYRSLEECLKHPRCISNKWLDEVSTVDNSPRPLKTAPYNDGASYWVDKDNDILTMSFPAVLETDGKFSKIGPYFNLAGEREIKVSIFPSYREKKKETFFFSNQRWPRWVKLRQFFNSHLCPCYPHKTFLLKLSSEAF